MKEPIKLSAEENRGRIESYLKERFILQHNTIDKLYNDALSTLGVNRNVLTYNELYNYLVKNYPLDKDKIINTLREAITYNNDAVKYWNVVEFEENDEALVDFYYYALAYIITEEWFKGLYKKRAMAIYDLLVNGDIDDIDVIGLPGYDAERFKLTQGELLQLSKDLLFSLPPGSYTANLTWLAGVLHVNPKEWDEALYRQDITAEKKQNCKAPNKDTISIEFSRRIKL